MTPQESFEIAAKEVENMNEKHLNRREYLIIPRELVDTVIDEGFTEEGLSKDSIHQLRNLQVAQFLDLEGVERFTQDQLYWDIENGDCTYSEDVDGHEPKFILESSVTDKLLPQVVGPSREEWRSLFEKAIPDDCDWIASAILDRIKGGK